jgi:excisionase family DNA binding protein
VERNCFTVRQVAERLGVSRAIVYQLCAQKKLAHVRVGVGRGTIRIREQDLDDYLRGATVRPEDARPSPPREKFKHLRV